MRVFNEIHSAGGMWGSAMGDLKNAEPNIVKQIRNECVLFYQTWAGKISADYSKKEFEKYLDSFLPESSSASMAHKYALELIDIIDSRAAIRSTYQENQNREAESRRQDEIRNRQEAEQNQREHEEMMRQFELDSQQPDEPIEEDIGTMEKRLKLRSMQIISNQMDDIEEKLTRLPMSGLPEGAKEEEEAMLRAKLACVHDQFIKLQFELDM